MTKGELNYMNIRCYKQQLVMFTTAKKGFTKMPKTNHTIGAFFGPFSQHELELDLSSCYLLLLGECLFPTSTR
jgi:hypothetical protein